MFFEETVEHTPHKEWMDLCKMDGLFSGQFDSLLQINREQSESSIVPSNVICPCINSRPECIIVKY